MDPPWTPHVVEVDADLGGDKQGNVEYLEDVGALEEVGEPSVADDLRTGDQVEEVDVAAGQSDHRQRHLALGPAHVHALQVQRDHLPGTR